MKLNSGRGRSLSSVISRFRRTVVRVSTAIQLRRRGRGFLPGANNSCSLRENQKQCNRKKPDAETNRGTDEQINPQPVPYPPQTMDARPNFESAAGEEHPETCDAGLNGGLDIDILEWYPRYQSCQRYFLDHAQHSGPVQALSSFLNIKLPFQQPDPTPTSRSSVPAQCAPPSLPGTANPSPPTVSLIPYVRRLVATGMDFPGVLHGFFGDDWVAGVGPLHEQERQNYLFAAKSGGWASVKKDYDMPPHETIPFLRPLQGSSDAEIEAAERRWSEWLAMEDWMLGPRAPDPSP